jgi:hypothetical protein
MTGRSRTSSRTEPVSWATAHLRQKAARRGGSPRALRHIRCRSPTPRHLVIARVAEIVAWHVVLGVGRGPAAIQADHAWERQSVLTPCQVRHGTEGPSPPVADLTHRRPQDARRSSAPQAGKSPPAVEGSASRSGFSASVSFTIHPPAADRLDTIRSQGGQPRRRWCSPKVGAI